MSVESTQSNIPVKDFVNGFVVDTNNRFIKITEVFPTPFFYKSIEERNIISSKFASIAKVLPSNFQIKCVSNRISLKNQINEVKEAMAHEKNLSCLNMSKNYANKLIDAQSYGIERKFYLCYPYENSSINAPSLDKVLNEFNGIESKLKSILATCGNKTSSLILTNKDVENANYINSRLFYDLLNKDKKASEGFDLKVNEINKKYSGSKAEFVPPIEYISPSFISFESSKYVKVNDTYYAYLYISRNGYPENVYAGWLDSIINSYEGIDADIFFKKLDSQKIVSSLNRNIAQAKASSTEAQDTSDSHDTAIASLNSSYYLRNGIKAGQDLYNVSVLISVSGKSQEEVEEKCNDLINYLKVSDIRLKRVKYGCEQAFKSSLPLSYLDEDLEAKMARNFLSNDLSSLYPFTTFQMVHDNGIYLADSASNGSPVILNFFDNSLFQNQHIFLCGSSGAGKTISLMLMTLRARIKQIPVMLIAPEKEDEFKELCESIGGQFVSFGPGSKYKINIMDIYQPKDGELPKNSLLLEKVAVILEFLQIFLKDISVIDKQLLSQAITSTYHDLGINEDNNSLWQDASHTKFKPMPILQDLVNKLEKSEKTKDLALSIKYLTSGVGTHFNGQTNVDIDNKYIVIGLEHNTEEILPLSAYVVEKFFSNKIRENSDKKIFAIDEAWVFLSNGLTAENLRRDSKIFRAFNCQMITATQQMNDIMAYEDGKYGEAVLNNSATKIVMKLEKKDRDSVSNLLELTKNEEAEISSFTQGYGLLISNSNRLSIRFNPTTEEALVCFTDENSKKKRRERQFIARIKKQKEAKIKKIFVEERNNSKLAYKNLVALEKALQERKREKGALNGNKN